MSHMDYAIYVFYYVLFAIYGLCFVRIMSSKDYRVWIRSCVDYVIYGLCYIGLCYIWIMSCMDYDSVKHTTFLKLILALCASTTHTAYLYDNLTIPAGLLSITACSVSKLDCDDSKNTF